MTTHSVRTIHLLVDIDHLALGPAQGILDDAALVAALADVAGRVPAHHRARLFATASRYVAFQYKQVLTLLPNNSWQTRADRAGSVQLLADELEHLGRRPTTQEVLLVGSRAEYAPGVAVLVRRGVPVTVLAHRRMGGALAAAATCARVIDPESGPGSMVGRAAVIDQRGPALVG